MGYHYHFTPNEIREMTFTQVRELMEKLSEILGAQRGGESSEEDLIAAARAKGLDI